MCSTLILQTGFIQTTRHKNDQYSDSTRQDSYKQPDIKMTSTLILQTEFIQTTRHKNV